MNTNAIRTNRAGNVESCAGIAVHHILEPSTFGAGTTLAREITRLEIEAQRTLDATHAERCRQTARELSALLMLWRVMNRSTGR